MSEKNTSAPIEYPHEVQKLLLEYMLSDHTAFARSQDIVKPEFFNEKLRKTARFIKEYFSDYNKVAPNEVVQATTGVELQKLEPEIIIGAESWYFETIESFCRHKSIENTILDAPELLDKGQYGLVEERIKESMMISLNTDMGTDYFADPLGRLEAMRDRNGIISTGWRDIDAKLYGGMNRGELTFFAGGPGTGKSLFLQNLALNWIQMGLNVVYITLELSENLVALRFDAMITEQETKSVMKDINGSALKVSMVKKANNWGKLSLKKFPESGTTANKIRAYLREYEIKYGFKPDGICVDYLDLLHPNAMKIGAGDMFVKDKYTSEELRALAAEFNILAATASQLNRGSIQEQNFDASHMAGGISKINTADNVLAIYMSPQMREIGQYQIQFLKTRSSSGVGSHVFLKFSTTSLRIMDADDTQGGGSVPTAFSKITEEIKKSATSSVVKAGPASAPATPTAPSGTHYTPGAPAAGQTSGPAAGLLKARALNLAKKDDF